MSKKTMIVAASSIVGILVLLILFVWLLSAFKKNYTTYENVEEKMILAAKNYYKTYPDLLPVDEGKYTLQYSALVEGKFIKPLNELLKDGDSCTAEVNVYKNDIDYDYIPRLYCGENYQTTELYQKILSENPVVTEGSGLYQDEHGGYYFRGKLENVYVSLGSYAKGRNTVEIIWKIMGIDANGNIKIKSLTAFNNKTTYDNRYNIDTKRYTGYNDFEGSQLRDFLIKMNNDSIETNSYALLTNEEKQKLVPMPLCVGKRKEKSKKNDGSVECATQTEPLYFGTITPYEFIRASLDENCKKVNDLSCGNFNYLYDSSTVELSVTASKTDNYKVYVLNGSTFYLSNANNTKKVYPTAYINSRVLYRTGDGSKANPYKLIIKNTSSKKKK